MNNFLKKHLNEVIAFLVALFISIGIFIILNGFMAEDTSEIIKDLCDAFSVTGLMYIFLGLLIFIGNDGFFSILSYGVKIIFASFKKEPKVDKFYDHKQKRIENPAPYKHLLIVGAIYTAIGMIFLAIFYLV